MIGALMLDIEGTCLTVEDRQLLAQPQVGGLILFGRNIQNPQQVRDLTDSIRAVRPDILIAVDQEGGRVQRLRQGFSKLPPMRAFGRLYDQQPKQALSLAEQCGWLMAIEVLAVGIDFSFAPVLDLDGISQVIGDRGFHSEATQVVAIAAAFMQGMKRAGMATTGKHFPGHGSVEADSHIAAPVDSRCLEDIERTDMQTFIQLQPQLDALMPAHVIYDRIDPNPAGFSPFWLQSIIRKKLNFDGVLFSDDLTMQAACVVGGAGKRIKAALNAGCDMGLVCNDRTAALDALTALQDMPLPNQQRLEKMRGKIPSSLMAAESGEINLGDAWSLAKTNIQVLLV
ncbi:MAG: beta-N-acetylhexosaminidase [Moraxellaceae bacterium]|nr:MAG: beta-N-acetylhexosaminidase [Moraxellaceae bacterium]